MMNQIEKEMSDLRLFRTVFYYCIIIIALPVITFFVSKLIICDSILGLSSVTSNVYSAISSIAVLHVALGLYIYKAYSETKPSKQD